MSGPPLALTWQPKAAWSVPFPPPHRTVLRDSPVLVVLGMFPKVASLG